MRRSTPEYADWLALGRDKPAGGTSPFYSRIYAGYSPAQLNFLIKEIGSARGRVPVFDPMAGQAFALSTLTWWGHEVHINDLNQAPLLLAWLRSARILSTLKSRIEEFRDWLQRHRRELNRLHIAHRSHLPFVTSWLSDAMAAQISAYGELVCGSLRAHQPELALWPEDALFRMAVLLLAARRIACTTKSDNRTWLKPGGIDNKPPLTMAIEEELGVLENCALAQSCKSALGLFRHEAGNLKFSCQDIASKTLRPIQSHCVAVTSPPYANRLDYSVMWAPELWTLSTAIPTVDRDQVRMAQIGTTKLRKDSGGESLSVLPPQTRRELRQIEDSPEYASQRYYAPFFRQFAIDLMHGLEHSLNSAPRAERWIIFIRDTARKDVMFSSHAICDAVMSSAGYRRAKRDDLQIIRSHVGVLRKSHSTSSVVGLAQREWWLTYHKGA